MAAPVRLPTIADFLAWENEQPERHEFYRGEIFAMVGAWRVHGTIGVNLGAALKTHLRGGPCRAFVEGMKVQVADDAVFYPDVFVTCDERDLRTEMIFRHPRVIVEVSSESTLAYDRSLTFSACRRLARLQEHVLVDPATRSVEVYRRNEHERFELHDYSGTASLVLASIDFALPMAEVFDGVEDEPAPSVP